VVSKVEIIQNMGDPLWRLNNLYKGIDDQGRVFNFRLNAAQERLMEDLWYFNLILKSRQHGFTTLIALLGLDSALFNENYSVGFCAHTREDAGLIFENKVKFPYDNLEAGIRERIPARTDRANTLAFDNNSKIVVGTSLRSGTYQLVHISEFGKICAQYPHKAKEIVTGALETIHAGAYSFIESTAEGSEGYFHDWCMDAIAREQQGTKLNQLQYKLHFFAWFEDPKNKLPDDTEVITKDLADYFATLEASGIVLSNGQKCWYAAKRRTLGDDIFREHPSTPQEAFKASVDGAYLSSQMAALRKQGQITTVPWIPRAPVNTAWDIGVNDQMWIVFHQRVGLIDRVWGCMYGESEGVDYYWREMQRVYPDVIWGRHFLPHDAGHRQKGDGKTIEDHCYDIGMRNVHVVSRTPAKISAINQTRAFLPSVYIDEENCAPLIKCLDGYRREWDEANGCFKEKPRHNWAGHGYDAFESLARGLEEYGPAGKGVEEISPSDGALRKKIKRSRKPARSWKTR